jgi:aldehyde reductase
MESLVDEGLVKSIGLSNFNEHQIERILNICKYKPVVNQVEIHPYCPQIELDEFCQKHHILLQAYAPLGQNSFSLIILNQFHIGAKDREWKKRDDPEILEDPIIKSISQKYNVHPATILIRYIIDRNIICVVKSSNHQRIQQNFDLFKQNQFHLTEEDLHKIHNEIKIKFRYYKMEDAKDAKEHPFQNWKDFVPQKH